VIERASTSVAAFLGGGPTPAVRLSSFADFERQVGLSPESHLRDAVQLFFLNGGREAWVAAGLQALDDVDPVNLLCLPDASDPAVIGDAIAYAERRRAFVLLDFPAQVEGAAGAQEWLARHTALRRANAAIYFPRLRVADPSGGGPRTVPACGAVAGAYARLDEQRGVWKAPSGLEAALRGVLPAEKPLTEAENRVLGPLGINGIRSFPDRGSVVWGSRTLAVEPEWRYVPVRRLALFLEDSLYRGTKWAVFEPNGESLWSRIRLSADRFLTDLFREGALQGRTTQEAFFVKCDAQTTTQDDIDNGRLNMLVGFAPLKPAEFVLIRIQQLLTPRDPP
jgi:Bacteriophage tail sheath protein